MRDDLIEAQRATKGGFLKQCSVLTSG